MSLKNCLLGKSNLIVCFSILIVISCALVPPTWAQNEAAQSQLTPESFMNARELHRHHHIILNHLSRVGQKVTLGEIPIQMPYLKQVTLAADPALQLHQFISVLADLIITQAPTSTWVPLRHLFFYDKGVTSYAPLTTFHELLILYRINWKNTYASFPLGEMSPNPTLFLHPDLKPYSIEYRLIKLVALLEIIQRLQVYDQAKKQPDSVEHILLFIIHTLSAGLMLDEIRALFPSLDQHNEQSLSLIKWIAASPQLQLDQPPPPNALILVQQKRLRKMIFGPISGNNLIENATRIITDLRYKKSQEGTKNYHALLNQLKSSWNDWIVRSAAGQNAFAMLRKAQEHYDSLTAQSSVLRAHSVCASVYRIRDL